VLIKSETHFWVLIDLCFENKYSSHKKYSPRVDREENILKGVLFGK
jgi:hypothetical protein